MTAVRVEHDGTTPHPPFGGSLAYLLLNLPLGIAWFTLLVTFVTVGVSTAIIWVGLLVAGFAVLLWRGGAHVERARAYALLDISIPLPDRSLPDTGQAARWRARLRDAATWRELAYLLLLLPAGIIQSTLVVSFWSTSIALTGLPVYYRFLPSGAYHFPGYDVRWITVDSAWGALPWAAVGVLCIALSIKLTRALAAGHARFARSLLGPPGSARPDTAASEAPTPFGRVRPPSTAVG